MYTNNINKNLRKFKNFSNYILHTKSANLKHVQYNLSRTNILINNVTRTQLMYREYNKFIIYKSIIIFLFLSFRMSIV